MLPTPTRTMHAAPTVLPMPLKCEYADIKRPSWPVNFTSGAANAEAMMALRSWRCGAITSAAASSHGLSGAPRASVMAADDVVGAAGVTHARRRVHLAVEGEAAARRPAEGRRVRDLVGGL